MSKANDEERLSSDGEWVEDEWVVMEEDIHAKWVRTLSASASMSIRFCSCCAVNSRYMVDWDFLEDG